MAAKKRKQYTADFKAKVALAACKGDKTANQLASEYSVGPTQISQWKSTLLNQSYVSCWVSIAPVGITRPPQRRKPRKTCI